ncbi:hypothetical protein pb186bvf_005897 [Paramecium bursaria]
MFKLYIDWISQPSRACKTAFDILHLKYETIPLWIQYGQHKTEEITKLNPLQQLPILVDSDGFTIVESHAIIKYIINSRNIQTTLYPSDHQLRAKIDQYLDYHHGNTRKCFTYYYNILIAPKLGIKTGDDILKLEQVVNQNLSYIQNYYLKDKDYLFGNNVTIADISACSEIMQLNTIKFDFDKHPKLLNWMLRVMEIQEMKDSHQVIMKIIRKQNPNCIFLNI